MDDANKLWVGPVLPTLDHIHEQGMSLNAWLEKKIAEMGTDAWVAMLDSAFPHIPGVNYLRHEDTTVPGNRNLRPWQLGIHVDTGNAGIMVQEDTVTLMQLMCVFGFRTDADTYQGVEKLANRPCDPHLCRCVPACRDLHAQAILGPDV